MRDSKNWEKLLKSEIKEVVGCTEPASIAYAVARARATVGQNISEEFDPARLKVILALSHDVNRNVSTVNVPVIREKGAKAAAACGLYARPDSLNLFPSINDEDLEKIYELLDRDDWLEIEPLDKRGIFVEATCLTDSHCSRAVISGEHDSVEELSCDGEIVQTRSEESLPAINNLEAVLGIVTNDDGSLKEIVREFITRQGKIFDHQGYETALEAVEKVIRGRMAGDSLRIQTITGSGNQGIFMALPLYEQYKEQGDKFLPAALFAVLVQIYLVQNSERISDSCGLTAHAALSLLAGLMFDSGAGLLKIEKGMELLAESMRGIVCEGAKASCALKGYMALKMVYKLAP